MSHFYRLVANPFSDEILIGRDSIKETINETVNQQAETPSYTKTKAVLNQAVADLSVAASIVTKFIGICVVLVSSIFIQNG